MTETKDERLGRRVALLMLTVLCVYGVLACGLAMALSADASVNVTIAVDGNVSNASITYPGGNISLDLSMNSSNNLNFNVPVPLQNLTFTLPSNTTYNLSGAYDVLQLTCNAPAAFPSCNVSVALTANQVFSQVDGVCNVHASCTPGTVLLANGSECPAVNTTCQASNQTANLTITKPLTITKTGNIFTIGLDNFTTAIDSNFINATQTINVPYTCPVDLRNLSGGVSAQDLFNVCTGYAPLFEDWLNVTINRCADNFQAYRDDINRRNSDVAKANQDLSDCRADSGKKDGTIQGLNAQIASQASIIGSDGDREQVYVICLSVAVFLIIALAVAVAMLLHRAGAE